MKREHFVKVVEDALDSLPQEFRSRIRNVAVLVEDLPPNQPSAQSGQQRQLLLGLFHGVPTTKKSIFDLPTGPDYVVLYQKNIEAVRHFAPRRCGIPSRFKRAVMALGLRSSSANSWKMRRTVAISFWGPGTRTTRSLLILLYSPSPRSCFGLPSTSSNCRR